MSSKPVPPKFLALCRTLRQRQTPAEQLLWSLVRNRRLDGRKFRRQHPCSGFVLDFYCPEEKLVIELDGSGHLKDEQRQSDLHRTEFLKSTGLRVLRFWNNQVTQQTETVLQVIWDALNNSEDE